jgi:hypothetical protein
VSDKLNVVLVVGTGSAMVSALDDLMEQTKVTPTSVHTLSLAVSEDAFVKDVDLSEPPKNRQPFYMTVPKRKRGRKHNR